MTSLAEPAPAMDTIKSVDLKPRRPVKTGI